MEFKDYDGKHKPRPSQISVLEKINALISDKKLIQLKLATGFGKSSIAVALLKNYPKQTVILTSSNQLVDQYQRDYPDVICIKGKDNYCNHMKSVYAGYSRNAVNNKPTKIPNCEYCQNRCVYPDYKKRIEKGESFVTNISFYIWQIMFNPNMPKTSRLLILDEYDTMTSLILSMTEMELPTLSSNPFLLKELAKKDNFLNRLAKKIFLDLVESDEEIFLDQDTKRGVTKVLSIIPSSRIVRLLTYNNKIIQMSGTLNDYHATELRVNPKNVGVIETEHVIPSWVRQIHYNPLPINAHVNDVVAFILSKYEANENMLVHCTYEHQEKLRSALTAKLGNRVITNNRSSFDKNRCVNLFKQKKGLVWLGAGVAVGVDLADDLCRIQIIPKIIWSHKDDYIDKCIALRGSSWYNAEALRVLIQSCGRSSRNENDISNTYILDSRLPALIKWGRSRGYCPEWFSVTGLDF